MDRGRRSFGTSADLRVGAALLGAALLAVAFVAAMTSGPAPLVIGVALLGALLAFGGLVAVARQLRAATASRDEAVHEAELAATRLRVLVEHVPAAVYIDMMDPGVSDGGRLAYMSPQILGILGYPPEALVDDPELWPSRIHPDDREAAIAAYDAHWRTGQPLRAEYRMIAKDGREVWIRDEAFAMPDDTRSGRQVSQGFLVDTTDSKRLEEKLVHDALHDPLTGLANRVLLRDHLERAIARRGRSAERVALLFVDLDDFKGVNDTYGHAAGDEILRMISERLAASVRAEDVVARQSGDEFAVLLTEVGGETEAVGSANRILAELRRPVTLGARSLVVGGSVGIAVAPPVDVDTSAEEILLQADAAMYAAKRSGKGTYAVFDAVMPTRTWSELEAAG
jgi:diguanylate cyclase (GGDEF)-like protein/PAS domain S-box-containing protein